MSTECMQLLDPSEDRLDKGDSRLNHLDITENLIGGCDMQKKQRNGALSDLSEQLLKRFDVKEKQLSGKVGQSLQEKEQELRKPRRKDTPALNIAPLLQGCKLVKDLKEGGRTIAEDEEEENLNT
ncbi:protein phosphatase 1 regulatory subunit 17 isoform X2 [Lissotriton helveticus]